MKECFKDKVVLVTGAAQGIGLATAQEFAKAGARVVLSDVLDMKEQVKELTDAGFSAVEYKCDVSSPEQVENMINWIVEKYGRLDCGFNNAGVQTPQRPMAEITYEEFDKMNGMVRSIELTKMLDRRRSDEVYAMQNAGSKEFNKLTYDELQNELEMFYKLSPEELNKRKLVKELIDQYGSNN